MVSATEKQVKERPILFSAPMIRAILEGRKTQTRRVIKFKNSSLASFSYKPVCLYPYSFRRADAVWDSFKTIDELAKKHCPYGSKGDRLWIRETWLQSPVDQSYWYKADDHEEGLATVYNYRWKPSIHMPRSASRINLIIKNIRVEKLQEITEEDAVLEGLEVKDTGKDFEPFRYLYGIDGNFKNRTAVGAFAKIWDSINADRGYSWDSNPFVWVIEFEREAK